MSTTDRNLDPGPSTDHQLTMCMKVYKVAFLILFISVLLIDFDLLTTMKPQPMTSYMKKYPNVFDTNYFMNGAKYSKIFIMTYINHHLKSLITPYKLNNVVRNSLNIKCATLRSLLNCKSHSKTRRNQNVNIMKTKKYAFFRAVSSSLKHIKTLLYLTKKCFRVLITVFQKIGKFHQLSTNFSFTSKIVRKDHQLSKTRKCSSFSRAPSKALMRMCRTHFRFGKRLWQKF